MPGSIEYLTPKLPGRTHFALDAADLAALRQLRVAAAARIAEMRQELAEAEAELAVLQEALEEAEPDGAA